MVYAKWKPRWAVIVLPCLLWVGTMVTAIIDLYYTSTMNKLVALPHDKIVRPYLLASLILSLSLNILVAGVSDFEF